MVTNLCKIGKVAIGVRVPPTQQCPPTVNKDYTLKSNMISVNPLHFSIDEPPAKEAR